MRHSAAQPRVQTPSLSGSESEEVEIVELVVVLGDVPSDLGVVAPRDEVLVRACGVLQMGHLYMMKKKTTINKDRYILGAAKARASRGTRGR